MTPKEQYEARKTERLKLKDMEYQVRQRTESLMLMDIMDRLVVAAERIADAMEVAAHPPIKFDTEPAYPHVTTGMSENGIG